MRAIYDLTFLYISGKVTDAGFSRSGLLALLLPVSAFAQEATIKEVHDVPQVRGSIIANLLQEHDNPFTLYPYESNYLLYTDQRPQ